MSITRVGLSETQKFASGYAAIFGGRRPRPAKPAKVKKKPPAKKAKPRRKKR